MSTFRKTACAALVAGCMAVGATGAQAALVNFTLMGTTSTFTTVPNVFGVGVGDTVTVTGTFDDSVLSGGTGLVYFDSNLSGTNSFELSIGTYTFSNTADPAYSSGGYPYLDITGPTSAGLMFVVEFDGHAFDSWGNTFVGWESGFDRTVFGGWNTFGMTPVPVPAAVWLLGSGLIGLAGIAKRKRVA